MGDFPFSPSLRRVGARFRAARGCGPARSVKPLFRRRDAFPASTIGRVQPTVPRQGPLAAYETPPTAARRNCLLPAGRLPPPRIERAGEAEAIRHPARSRRLSMARAVHESTRSESEGERWPRNRQRPDFVAPVFRQASASSRARLGQGEKERPQNRCRPGFSAGNCRRIRRQFSEHQRRIA